jgi:hypothetical protein
MTKQQTIELLNQQLPGFYSVEQVIKIINDIETPTAGGSLTEDQINRLIEVIADKVESNAENLTTDEVCDVDSAEFDLNGNEISLSSVDVNTTGISEAVVYGVGEAIEEFFEELEN